MTGLGRHWTKLGSSFEKMRGKLDQLPDAYKSLLSDSLDDLSARVDSDSLNG